VQFVGFDFSGQGPVFIGLGVRRLVFDDGFPVDFGLLDHVVPRDEVGSSGCPA